METQIVAALKNVKISCLTSADSISSIVDAVQRGEFTTTFVDKLLDNDLWSPDVIAALWWLRGQVSHYEDHLSASESIKPSRLALAGPENNEREMIDDQDGHSWPVWSAEMAEAVEQGVNDLRAGRVTRIDPDKGLSETL